jgi:methionyl-tRNA synthetase
MSGSSVVALTGTDEHGLKIERAAKDQSMEPQKLTDKYAESFQTTWQKLGIFFDEFIRTTQPQHKIAVGEIARRIIERGFIYSGQYSGDYCVSCEAYVSDGEKTCPDCGRPTEHMVEESYFFKLSAFQEQLLTFYESNSDFVIPSTRMNEIVSFVRSGLKDISISRTSFSWGIPFPDDPEHIFYVWFDALTGYLSGIGFADSNRDFTKAWPADVQFIGKDILRFHAVYWPAFLMAAGLEPPHHILVNGWWTVNGEKMSKSKGNFISAEELLAKLPADYIKYFLLREIPIGGDGDFSYEALIVRINADLANDIGNLTSRTLKMIDNYFEGKIPEPGSLEHGDAELVRFTRETVQLYKDNFGRFLINKALENVWELISVTNRYLVANEPWKLAKDRAKRERLNTVLYNAAEALRIIAVLLAPAVPDGSKSILMQLGQDTDPGKLSFSETTWGGLNPGTQIGKTDAVYPRLDINDFTTPDKSDVTASPVEENKEQSEPPENWITIDDFAKVEMKVAQVISVERVPKSSKLLKIKVDLGSEKRQIVAGIGKAYEPEDLIGRKVVIVANLEPVKLMGIESNGMIVAASDKGRPVLATFNEDVALGTRLR